MKTKVISLQESDSENAHTLLKEAAQIIKDGGLVAFPTETVYGLGGDALQKESSCKIYTAKGRPSDNPLIIHIANMNDLEKVVSKIPDIAYVLAEKFWPGPLTMIFQKNEKVPLETTGGLQTVAIRFPAHPIAQKLIEFSGGFVAAPSANTSGKPSPTIAKYVIEDMDGKIDMIIDGGEVGIGLESTIIDLTSTEPVILRPGFITEAMLQAIVSNITLDQALMDSNQEIIPKAPGMKYRHYAPKAKMTIITGEELDVVAYINEQVEKYKKQHIKTGIIATQGTMKLYQADCVKNIGSKQNAEEIAKHLFKILREFDDENIEMIYTESFSYDGIGQAIMNRLIKAAGNHVINLNEGGYVNDSNRK